MITRTVRGAVSCLFLALLLIQGCSHTGKASEIAGPAQPISKATEEMTAPPVTTVPSQTSTVQTQPEQAAPQSPSTRETQASAIPGNVRTYTLTQVTTWSTGQGQSRMETKWWYEAPDHVRIETTNTGPGLTGEVRRITVNDGVNTWDYDSGLKIVQSHPSEPGQPVAPVVSEKGRKLESATLDGLLRLESTCYSPSLKGTESVAGRSAYVLDLGPTKCPSSAAPEMNGRLVIWVDKETFFLLKWESYSTTDDSLVVGSLETTAIQYNVPIDAARFTLSAPNE